MKKFYALLLAGVMTVAFAMPTMAAPSPVAQAVDAVATVSSTVSGIGVGSLSQSAAAEFVSYGNDEKFLTDLNVPVSAEVAAVLDLTYSGDIPAGGVQIPLVVSSAKVGQTVYVLHRRDDLDGKPWEKVGQGVLGSDLTVTCTFTSFSPVIIMVADTNTTSVTAPKTGEY